MKTPKGLNMPYFALDEKNKVIVTEDGDHLSIKQFKKIIEGGRAVDMTLMTQRFISFGFDFDALDRFYAAN